MPYNGSGTFAASASSFNPAVADTTIDETDWNDLLTELEAALSLAICKDGQSTCTGSIAFAAGLNTNTIRERTAASGVTVDGVLLKDGGATLILPLDISGAAAGQIVFPASVNASANANTLDDYEEGSWTPGVSFGGGTTGITYTTQAGRYTKIGNLVTASFRIVLSSKGSSTGDARVTGLPFTVNSAEPTATAAIQGSLINLDVAGAFYTLTVATTLNATTLDLVEIGDNVSGASITDADFANTSNINGTISYHI